MFAATPANLRFKTKDVPEFGHFNYTTLHIKTLKILTRMAKCNLKHYFVIEIHASVQALQ